MEVRERPGTGPDVLLQAVGPVDLARRPPKMSAGTIGSYRTYDAETTSGIAAESRSFHRSKYAITTCSGSVVASTTGRSSTVVYAN